MYVNWHPINGCREFMKTDSLMKKVKCSFSKHHSTINIVIKFILHELKLGIDNYFVFVDFSEAFDTINNAHFWVYTTRKPDIKRVFHPLDVWVIHDDRRKCLSEGVSE